MSVCICSSQTQNGLAAFVWWTLINALLGLGVILKYRNGAPDPLVSTAVLVLVTICIIIWWDEESLCFSLMRTCFEKLISGPGSSCRGSCWRSICATHSLFTPFWSWAWAQCSPKATRPYKSPQTHSSVVCNIYEHFLEKLLLLIICLISRLPHAPGDHPELLPLAVRVFAQGETQQAPGHRAQYKRRSLPDCLPVYRAQAKTCRVTSVLSDMIMLSLKKWRKTNVTHRH